MKGFALLRARAASPAIGEESSSSETSWRLVGCLCLWLLLLCVVCLPCLVNHVIVNRVGITRRHLQVRESEFRRIGEAGHSLVPMRTSQNDAIPFVMNLGRSIAQIRHSAVEYPCATAVDIGGVATIADEFAVKHFALLYRFLGAGLLWRLWHGR